MPWGSTVYPVRLIWIGASRKQEVTCSQAKTPCLKCLISSPILKINLPPTGMPFPAPASLDSRSTKKVGPIPAESFAKLFSSYLHPLPELKCPPPTRGFSPPRQLHRSTRFLGGQSFPSKICSFSQADQKKKKKQFPHPSGPQWIKGEEGTVRVLFLKQKVKILCLRLQLEYNYPHILQARSSFHAPILSPARVKHLQSSKAHAHSPLEGARSLSLLREKPPREARGCLSCG